jgi:hypothetical protein
MIQVIGRFKKQNNRMVLIIDLEEDYFKKVKSHIINSMFFAYRRIAPLYKSIILSSIGDHLDKSDKQNLEKAEVSIVVKIEDKLSKEEIYLLNTNTQWYVCCKYEAEIFTFSLEKENQMIYSRNYTDVG